MAKVKIPFEMNTYTAQLIIQQAREIERFRKLADELLNSLTEMADKGMLPKISVRLRDSAQALEQAVHGE